MRGGETHLIAACAVGLAIAPTARTTLRRIAPAAPPARR
jgi:hypothetical protein